MILVDLVCCLFSFCSNGELFSEHHSLRLVSRNLQIVIFSSLCKFMYCCLETMLRFLKNYLVISKKRNVLIKVLFIYESGFVIVFHV